MAEFPALPLWTDAYLGDTTHLTTIEHGAYLLLLMAMWRSKECTLPNDDKLLARYAKLTAGQWARIKPVLMPFFTVSSDQITQGRLTDEAKLVRQNSKKASDSAKARWLKIKESGDADAERSECEGNAPTPTPTPLEEDTSNEASSSAPQQPEPQLAEPTNEPEAKVEKSKRGTRLPEGAQLPPEWAAWARDQGVPNPQALWDEFHDYWIAVPGAKGCKLNWQATWQNRVRAWIDRNGARRPARQSTADVFDRLIADSKDVKIRFKEE